MRTALGKDNMACRLFAVLIICILMHLNNASETTNFMCHQLEKVFPNCTCGAAPEETKSIYPVVDCSNRELEQVPTMQDTYGRIIYKFNLRDNKINRLTDSSFQGMKIENIDLSGNALVSVENNTFFSMKDTLRTLEIDGDQQSLPPINSLKMLTAIQSLTMRNYNVPILEHKDNYFLSFTHLKSLTLDRWKTKHIEGSSFLGLDRLESLALLNQAFVNLPVDGLRDDPFDNLETLQISHCPVKRVTHSVFSNLSKLKKLDLSNNEIEELEDECFNGVRDTLQTLNLQGNILNNDNGKLSGLTKMEALEQLDLSHNTFQSIPRVLNLGLKKPLSLLLNHNDINVVPENSFVDYGQHLRDLDLRENYISTMDEQSFFGVTNLTSIFLQDQRDDQSQNFALHLPTSLTNSASTLQTMDLSGQNVDPDSLWNVVKEMKSLVSLNIKSTQLSSIPDNTFVEVTNLEHIDLSYNALLVITQKSLAGARMLKTVNLMANNIITIPSCLFYGFLSPEINLALGLNPIICDCKIRKLLEDVETGRIVLDSNGYSAACSDGTPLTSLKSDSVCSNPLKEETCSEYYTTTAPITTEPITNPGNPQLELIILDVGLHTVKISWTVTDATGLDKFKVHVSSTNSITEFTRDNIETSQRVIEATGLPSNTHVTLCVTAYFNNGGKVEECKVEKTTSTTPNKQDLEDGNSESAKTGIIVGCVVAGVALIGIVIAVVILLVFRKRPKKVPDNYRPPTQPRSFAKAELPSMSDDSRTFAKPKKNGKGPHPGNNMQVVAISDGQTSPGARVGRVNMMFQPEDGYEPMSNFKKNGGSMYENDHGALPPTPGPDQDSRPPSYPGPKGYYNQGFNEDKYDEVQI